MTVATRSRFSAAASRPCRAHGAVNAFRLTLRCLCDDSHAAEVLHELFANSSYPTLIVLRYFRSRSSGGCLVHLLQPRSKRCCTPKTSGASVAPMHGGHKRIDFVAPSRLRLRRTPPVGCRFRTHMTAKRFTATASTASSCARCANGPRSAFRSTRREHRSPAQRHRVGPLRRVDRCG